jgi:hypothetical protein
VGEVTIDSWAIYPLWVEPALLVEDVVSAAVRRSTIPGMRLAEVDPADEGTAAAVSEEVERG